MKNEKLFIYGEKRVLKGRHLLGLPVVAISEGRRLGMVGDLLLDLQRRRLSALLLEKGGGWRGPALVLFQEVHSVGRDAVTVSQPGMVRELKKEAWLESLPSSSLRCLIGRRIINVQGDEVGTLEDLFFHMPQGKFAGLEVSAGLIADFLWGRDFLEENLVQVFGNEVVVVKKKGRVGKP
ncbi:PRC-barrel domain-containing protein [Calderihabitans maritimus]|uniref:PRC-barrel domain-containing protein n=1 Tax=Calderihabitans maritimus TaxID=1246530 RepID=A0A1Z5HT15_9FIRM|nr:PRC-barrel domain-containing protein [Calderihabitans maritimus]GAW92672.1 PRC-barrel domain-containing protein [Calderihabitans maritimus]